MYCVLEVGITKQNGLHTLIVYFNLLLGEIIHLNYNE